MNYAKKVVFGFAVSIILVSIVADRVSVKRDPSPVKPSEIIPPLPPMPERGEQAPVLEREFRPVADEWVIISAGPDIDEPEIDPFTPCSTNIYRLKGVVWASSNLTVLTNVALDP